MSAIKILLLSFLISPSFSLKVRTYYGLVVLAATLLELLELLFSASVP